MAEASGVPDADHLAVLYERDRAYRQLGRLAGLLRGAEFPPNSLNQALQEIDGSSISGLRTLALAVHGAVGTLKGERDYRPATHGGVAGLIRNAADHLSTAGDLLATHIELVPYVPRFDAVGLRQTVQGQAIVAGVERDAAVGELARIALALMRLDPVLEKSPTNSFKPDASDDVCTGVHQLVASRFGDELRRYAGTEPAYRLRSLKPAAPWDRSAGARAVTTLRSVAETAAAVSNAVRQDRNNATVGLLDSLARLGFATTLAAGIAAGEADWPSPETAAKAGRWKSLHMALAPIRDDRDNVAPELPIEVRRAAAWLRDQIRTERPSMQTWTASIVEIEGILGSICRQATVALRKALVDRHLWTAVVVAEFGDARGGLRAAQKRWGIAVPSDDDVFNLLQRLTELGELAVTWTPAAAVSMAFPRSARRSLARRTQLSPPAARGSRHLDPSRDEPSR